MTVKFCKDCRHYRPGPEISYVFLPARCSHPGTAVTYKHKSLVDGHSVSTFTRTCHELRKKWLKEPSRTYWGREVGGELSPCGPSGKYWEGR